MVRSNRLTFGRREWQRTRKDGPISTLLFVLAGWLALSVVTFVLFLPLLTASGRAERRFRKAHPRGLAPPSEAGVPGADNADLLRLALEDLIACRARIDQILARRQA